MTFERIVIGLLVLVVLWLVFVRLRRGSSATSSATEAIPSSEPVPPRIQVDGNATLGSSVDVRPLRNLNVNVEAL